MKKLVSKWDMYGMPNTSEVTSIFVDNQKFVLSIRITLLIIWKYKMLPQGSHTNHKQLQSRYLNYQLLDI